MIRTPSRKGSGSIITSYSRFNVRGTLSWGKGNFTPGKSASKREKQTREVQIGFMGFCTARRLKWEKRRTIENWELGIGSISAQPFFCFISVADVICFFLRLIFPFRAGAAVSRERLDRRASRDGRWAGLYSKMTAIYLRNSRSINMS